jgi:hypothetical protein
MTGPRLQAPPGDAVGPGHEAASGRPRRYSLLPPEVRGLPVGVVVVGGCAAYRDDVRVLVMLGDAGGLVAWKPEQPAAA